MRLQSGVNALTPGTVTGRDGNPAHTENVPEIATQKPA
jgi:hypothetical protein